MSGAELQKYLPEMPQPRTMHLVFYKKIWAPFLYIYPPFSGCVLSRNGSGRGAFFTAEA